MPEPSRDHAGESDQTSHPGMSARNTEPDPDHSNVLPHPAAVSTSPAGDNATPDSQRVVATRERGRRSRWAELSSSSILRSRIERLYARIEALDARSSRYEDAESAQVAQVISRLIDGARTALNEGRLELAWRLISEAEREELQLFTSEALLARAVAIGTDAAANLPTSAQRPIAELVGRVEGANGKPAENIRELVSEAVRFYDSWTITLFNRAERVNNRVFLLTALLIFLVGILAFYVLPKPDLVTIMFVNKPFDKPMTFEYLLCAGLLGGIGACASALLSFTTQGRAPDDFEGIMVTLARPAIGVTSGFIIMLAALAGVLTLGSSAMLTLLAFAAGFSERLIIGTIERVGGQSGSKDAASQVTK